MILFVLPLGLDTFAVSAALGLHGLPRRRRLRVSLLLTGFELAMPVVGLLLGRGLGAAIGGLAGYVAAAALFVLGLTMLREDAEGEEEKVAAVTDAAWPALLALGVGISLDELAMGFTIGLLHLPLWLTVALIGAQAFLAAQVGLAVGARLGRGAGEWSERLAGGAMIGLAALILVERLI
ncbi:MAG TPA: manganese efflux pump [Solirubrobacteraceae bacterium]